MKNRQVLRSNDNIIYSCEAQLIKMQASHKAALARRAFSTKVEPPTVSNPFIANYDRLSQDYVRDEIDGVRGKEGL